MFAKQFFDTTAKWALAGIVAVHALAIPLLHAPTPSLIALAVISLATAAITWRSVHLGLLVAFAEIVVGGHGHLIHAELFGFGISIRIAIFAAVMAVWLIRVLQRKAVPKFLTFRDTPFVLLALALAIGTVNGFLMNDPAKAFDDMNGYLTVAYVLPLFSVVWDNEKKRDILQVLFAGALWVAVSTLVILFLFTHMPGKALHEVYAFVRDLRLAEVTLLTGPSWFVGNFLSAESPWYYRVFEPAHFFVLVVAFVLTAARFILWKGSRMPALARYTMVLCAAAFVASMSRSFMIGAFFGGVSVLLLSFWEARKPMLRFTRNAVHLAFLSLLGSVVFWAVIAFPFPAHPDLRDAAFYRASTGDERELAVSSRWNLLEPMFNAIMEHPILGSGFGREVTFISDDPRVRELNETGEWTTYRFEWGYQDLWLKMGLLGLAAFIAYAIVLTHAFMYTYKHYGSRWISIGLYAGAIALFATHLFSPYLNHPIGLGYLIFILPFFDWQGTAAYLAKSEEEREKQAVHMPAPAISVTQREGGK